MADYTDLTKVLIKEVKERPMLWDKKHEGYTNSQAVNKEWNKVAATLNRDREFVKKRWRRCRDVFRIELKKFDPPPNAPDPLKYYKGSWNNFENMLFLKDMISSRRKPVESDDESVLDTTENEGNIKFQEELTIESPYTIDIEEPTDTGNTEQIFFEERDWSEMRGTKRKANWDEDLDEDVNFAKSIVGYLRRLNPVRKLLVRNEIQNILLKEILCDNCKGSKNCCH